MAALNPSDVVANIAAKGVTKTGHTLAHVAVQGTLAGMYIAIGGLLAVVVAGGCPGLQASNPGLVKFLLGATFPVGLMMVVLMGADLFTGDVMYVTVSWLQRKVPTRRMLTHWMVVYLANFAGSLFVVIAFAVGAGLVTYDPWRAYARGLAEAKMALSWDKVLLRGIAGNWLVNVALFHALVAPDALGKMVAIWFPIMAFATMGFEHSVADMFFVPLGLFCGADGNVGIFLWGTLLPATIGNIIGGAVLVGVAQWFTYGRTAGDRFSAAACRAPRRHTDQHTDQQGLLEAGQAKRLADDPDTAGGVHAGNQATPTHPDSS